MTSTPPHKIFKFAHQNHVNHLRAQHKHLLALWEYMKRMSNLEKVQISATYRELAALLGQAVDKYEALINTLEGQLPPE